MKSSLSLILNQALKEYVFFPTLMLRGFLIRQVKMTIYYGQELSLIIIVQSHRQAIKKYKVDKNNYFIIKMVDIKEIKPLFKKLGFILKLKNNQSFIFLDLLNTSSWIKWLSDPYKSIKFK